MPKKESTLKIVRVRFRDRWRAPGGQEAKYLDARAAQYDMRLGRLEGTDGVVVRRKNADARDQLHQFVPMSFIAELEYEDQG